MSLMNSGEPVPLHEIPRGAYVLVQESWRQMESWRVLDKDSRRPESPRFQVCWAGLDLYPSTYRKEPSWPVWTGDEPPSATAVPS